MLGSLSPFVPAALGLACGVLVWAILCARARRRKRDQRPICGVGPRRYTIDGCGLCGHCSGVLKDGCVRFPHHGHVWCRCEKMA